MTTAKKSDEVQQFADGCKDTVKNDEVVQPAMSWIH